MDKDEILEMIREEIRQGIKISTEKNYGTERVDVNLIFNGEIISTDYFYLPEIEE